MVVWMALFYAEQEEEEYEVYFHSQINSPSHIHFSEIVTEFWICNKIAVNSINALFVTGNVCLKHTSLISLEVFV